MNKLKLTLFCFCLPLFLMGQKQNEVKFDGFGILLNHYEVSYERLINANLGFEFGVRYLDETQSLDTIGFQIGLVPPNSTFIFFKKSSFQFLLHCKYYFLPKTFGNRLFTGLLLSYETKSKIDQDYFDTYQDVWQEPSPISQKGKFILTINGGYKILVIEKIVIEPSLGLGVELNDFPAKTGGKGPSFVTMINIKAGYRF